MEVEVAGSLGWVVLVRWAEGEGEVEVEVEVTMRRDGRRRSSGSGESSTFPSNLKKQ